eukprot:970478_1
MNSGRNLQSHSPTESDRSSRSNSSTTPDRGNSNPVPDANSRYMRSRSTNKDVSSHIDDETITKILMSPARLKSVEQPFLLQIIIQQREENSHLKQELAKCERTCEERLNEIVALRLQSEEFLKERSYLSWQPDVSEDEGPKRKRIKLENSRETKPKRGRPRLTTHQSTSSHQTVNRRIKSERHPRVQQSSSQSSSRQSNTCQSSSRKPVTRQSKYNTRQSSSRLSSTSDTNEPAAHRPKRRNILDELRHPTMLKSPAVLPPTPAGVSKLTRSKLREFEGVNGHKMVHGSSRKLYTPQNKKLDIGDSWDGRSSSPVSYHKPPPRSSAPAWQGSSSSLSTSSKLSNSSKNSKTYKLRHSSSGSNQHKSRKISVATKQISSRKISVSSNKKTASDKKKCCRKAQVSSSKTSVSSGSSKSSKRRKIVDLDFAMDTESDGDTSSGFYDEEDDDDDDDFSGTNLPIALRRSPRPGTESDHYRTLSQTEETKPNSGSSPPHISLTPQRAQLHVPSTPLQLRSPIHIPDRSVILHQTVFKKGRRRPPLEYNWMSRGDRLYFSCTNNKQSPTAQCALRTLSRFWGDAIVKTATRVAKPVFAVLSRISSDCTDGDFSDALAGSPLVAAIADAVEPNFRYSIRIILFSTNKRERRKGYGRVMVAGIEQMFRRRYTQSSVRPFILVCASNDPNNGGVARAFWESSTLGFDVCTPPFWPKTLIETYTMFQTVLMWKELLASDDDAVEIALRLHRQKVNRLPR